MNSAPLVTARLTVAAVLAAALVDVLLYVLALSHLRNGPSQSGYSLLLAANRMAVGCASVVAASAIASVAVGAGRVRLRIAVLLIVAGAAFGIAFGLSALGSGLAAIATESQPTELSSLILAVWGTGQDLAPVSEVLALGAALLPLTALARDRVLERRAAVAPLRLAPEAS